MVTPNYNYEFQAGGSLAANAPSYIEREADTTLYRAVKAGKFAYVFNCRQMGKSSLRVQVENRLKSEGRSCATIDLSRLGVEEVTAAQWYRGIIAELNRQLDILDRTEIDTWLEQQVEITPIFRLHRFIEEVVLVHISEQPIVVFLDEIDSILSLPFPASDFFAWIRSCYNSRADNDIYKRLTFVLLGVTTPSQLIRDTERTPFNIGQAIELDGLTLEKSQKLTHGLVGWVDEPESVLTEIFAWTGGQPYLTQRLCELVQIRGMEIEQLPWIDGEKATDAIAQLVQDCLVQGWNTGDEQAHYETIKNRFLRREQLTSRMLSVYELILTKGRVPKDNSNTQVELRLTGVVVARNGNLQVFNPIYNRVFDRNWVQQTLDNLRPYSESFQSWIESGCVDETRLLRGIALNAAKAWAKDKSLSVQDDRYLRESQESENREVRLKLKESEDLSQEIEERRKTLEQINRDAEKQIHTQTRKIRSRSVFATAMLIASLIGVTAALGVFGQLEQVRGALRGTEKNLKATETELQNSREEVHLADEKLAESDKQIARKEQQLRILEDEAQGATTELERARQAAFVAQKEFRRAEQQRIEATEQAKKAKIQTETANQERKAAIADRRLTEDISRLERDATAALQLFLRSPLRGFRDAFVTAHKANEIYQKEGDEFIAFGSVFALQTILNQITNSTSGSVERGYSIAILEHQSDIASVQFSSNGERMATVGRNGEAWLWDHQGNPITKIQNSQEGPINSVGRLDFSPNGERIATVGTDGETWLWDHQGNPITKVSQESPYISNRFIGFSPNGELFANVIAIDNKEIVHLWDLQGGFIGQIDGHKTKIDSVKFSPNGERIATVGIDGETWLWDYQGDPITKIQGSQAGIFLTSRRPIEFNPNGKLFAIANNEIVHLWDLQGGFIGQIDGHKTKIDSVKFSPNGERIATVGIDGETWLWDYQGNPITKIQDSQAGVLGSHWLLEFSPNSERIAIVDKDQIVNVWEHQSRITQLKIYDEITGIFFSPDSKMIATLNLETSRIWSIHGQQISQYEGFGTLRNDWSMIATFIRPYSRRREALRGLGRSQGPRGSGDTKIVKLWPVYTHNRFDDLLTDACEHLAVVSSDPFFSARSVADSIAEEVLPLCGEI